MGRLPRPTESVSNGVEDRSARRSRIVRRRLVTGLLALLPMALLPMVLFRAATSLASQDSEDAGSAGERQRLVQQLGDVRFEKRQEATRMLRAIGLAAIPDLQAAVASTDPEIRHRAQVLLEYLFELQHKQALQAFLADPESAAGQRLIGWQRFKATIGDSPADRALLASMHERESRLLRMWANEASDRIEQALNLRCQEIQTDYRTSGRREVETASIATLLFIASDERVSLNDSTTNLLNSLLHYNNIKSELAKKSDDEVEPPLKRLAGIWIERTGNVNSDYQKLLLAMRYNIVAGLRPARSLLSSAIAPLQTQYALLGIGKLGSRDDLPTVLEFLENKTVLSQSVSGGRVTYRCEIRDVALAVAAHISGKPPQSLGFVKIRPNSSYLYSPNSAGFESDEKREQAFVLWREWSSKQAESGN